MELETLVYIFLLALVFFVVFIHSCLFRDKMTKLFKRFLVQNEVKVDPPKITVPRRLKKIKVNYKVKASELTNKVVVNSNLTLINPCQR